MQVSVGESFGGWCCDGGGGAVLFPFALFCAICAECDFVVPCVSECHGSHTETSEVICRFGLDQLKALQRSYGILQQDIFQFQKNQSSMEMKFTYDL